MSDETFINQLRIFHFLLSVLKNQQNDPFCSKCLSFSKAAEGMMDRFIKFETASTPERKKLPEEFSELFNDLYYMADSIQQPDNPVGQKKAGSCKLPEGVCFPKYAQAFMEKLKG